MKRTHGDEIKRSFYFPKDITRLFAFYLEGDDLLHFKLACKQIRKDTREMPCEIQVTSSNYKRTFSTPGFHVIKLDENSTEMRKYVQNITSDHFPIVKHLLIDYCGLKSSMPFKSKEFFIAFFNIQSLRIIRCADYSGLTIFSSIGKLSTLEIYSVKDISLTTYKIVENVRLCSTLRIQDSVSPTIRVIFRSFESKSERVQCCGAKVQYLTREHGSIITNNRNDFVPNKKFLF